MSKKNPAQYILPARFRLQKDLLADFGVHVFSSIWQTEANDLAKKLSGKVINAKTGLFNQAVLALSPVLVHGFKKTGGPWDKPIYQMLALEQYPGEHLVKSLAKNWADVWLKTSFPDIFPHNNIQAQRLYDLLDDTGDGWVAKSALEALAEKENGIRFSALPSLLAAHFASKGPSNINGHKINWGLIQLGNNGLGVVSDPQIAEGGTFAYLLRFSLQFQPGNSEPWIHTFLTCQRYMDKSFISGNKKRNATILLRLSRPLHLAWAHNQTLVRLSVRGVPTKGNKQETHPSFSEGFHELLDRAQARAIVRDPSLILNTPLAYRTVSDDNYFILYAEGYEPGHPLGSGFGAKERTEIFRDLEAKLQGLLFPGHAIPVIRQRLEARALAPWKSTENKAPSDPFQKHTQRLKAIKAACGNRPIKVLLASSNPEMGKAMRYFLVSRYLKFVGQDVLPPDFHVENIQIPDALNRPLEISDDAHKLAEKRLEAEIRMAENWRKFIRLHRGVDRERTLAWIELPSGTTDFTSPHNAIRMACVREGIASQMIQPLQSEYEKLINMGRYFGNKKATYDFGRLYNACGDLLLRQLGVSHGDTHESSLSDDYVRAGFAPEVAKKLVVIGLTIYRNESDSYRGRGAVNLPMAVRLFPNGKAEAKILNLCDWVDYFEAAIILGEAFIQQQRRKSIKTEYAKLFEFIKEILSEHRELPTLMILDAYKLRQQWGGLKVDSLKKNQLNLGGDTFELMSLPNMNIVWFRPQEDGETPQYVATNESSWAEVDNADKIAHSSLFEDTDANSIFRHFFSIGRLDNDHKVDQTAMRRVEGSEMYFKNQQMLEIVPFLGKDEEASAIATHLLRASPAWDIGNIILPYPIHLANKMVDDMVPLLGGVDDGDRED